MWFSKYASRHTDRQTDRQIETETDRHAHQNISPRLEDEVKTFKKYSDNYDPIITDGDSS